MHHLKFSNPENGAWEIVCCCGSCPWWAASSFLFCVYGYLPIKFALSICQFQFPSSLDWTLLWCQSAPRTGVMSIWRDFNIQTFDVFKVQQSKIPNFLYTSLLLCFVLVALFKVDRSGLNQWPSLTIWIPTLHTYEPKSWSTWLSSRPEFQTMSKKSKSTQSQFTGFWGFF